jgi:hypothetical protein
MARATNTYVVMPEGCMTPIAAFTVKHELLTWVGVRAVQYRIWRIKDGATGKTYPKVTDITHKCYATA